VAIARKSNSSAWERWCGSSRAVLASSEKSFLGKKFMGTNRVTFLIGPDGRIKKIWRAVKAAQHPAEVLAAL